MLWKEFWEIHMQEWRASYIRVPEEDNDPSPCPG